jgi:hypothetical protein
LITLTITSKTFAQCGGPVPVVSIYTVLDRGTSLGLGAEIGCMNDDSPWGYYGGVVFTIQDPEGQVKQSLQNTASPYPYDLSIYMKGSYRLFRSERTSIHLVTSAEIDTKSNLDLKSGVRLILPVSDRVAISSEALYSARNQKVTGKLGITIAL